MIDRLKPYPAYKVSGVAWLGVVPTHWTVGALRHRYEQCLGKMLDSKRIRGTASVPYLRNVDVQWDRINISDLPSMDIATAESERYTLRTGDLLVCEGGDVGRAAIWQGQIAICGFQKALHRLRPLSSEDQPRFLYYALRCAGLSGAFTDGHESTIPHLTGDKLRAHRFAWPPRSEQTAIVRFLDHADRRIRRYIRAKQRLIKLLEEQKQAISHRAVTRGLDPKVRLKPSGVEWLGDVPEHWHIRWNGRLYAQRNETGFAELPILEVSLKTGVQIRDFEASDRKQVMSDRGKYKRAARGDIAYNMMRMWQGAVGVAPVDGLVSPAYVVATARKGMEPRYSCYLFRTPAYMGEVDRYSRGIVKDRNRLYWEDFKQMQSPCPPGKEQVRIADWIDERTQALNETSEQGQRQIELVREYRTRVIADVVTGKLDVRDAAVRLPDVAEESEPLDDTEEPAAGGGDGEDPDLNVADEDAEA